MGTMVNTRFIDEIIRCNTKLWLKSASPISRLFEHNGDYSLATTLTSPWPQAPGGPLKSFGQVLIFHVNPFIFFWNVLGCPHTAFDAIAFRK